MLAFESRTRRPSRIALFEAPGATGTQAQVFWGQPPAQSDHPDYQGDAEAQCWLWQDDSGPQARCYNNGHPIAFCGHGLLACAYEWWLERGEPPDCLYSAEARYDIHRQDNTLWLACRSFPEPRPVQQRPRWFGETPVSAWAVGGEQGYLILQWPDGFDLENLQPDFAGIERHTKRAVIATSKAPDGSEFDAALRYFAPQYGNPEDSVTGSACVVIAGFWPGDDLLFRQFSRAGGLVQVRKANNTVFISGAMRRLSNHRLQYPPE